MAIFNVVTFVAKAENQDEVTQLMKELREHFFSNKKMYKEVKSMNFFNQVYGGICGAFIDLEEYDSFTTCEKTQEIMKKDKVVMDIYQKLLKLIEPGTYQINVWESIWENDNKD